jgi:hypothetical protein
VSAQTPDQNRQRHPHPEGCEKRQSAIPNRLSARLNNAQSQVLLAHYNAGASQVKSALLGIPKGIVVRRYEPFLTYF